MLLYYSVKIGMSIIFSFFIEFFPFFSDNTLKGAIRNEVIIMLGNKQIMAKNIRRQMDIKGVSAKDVCENLGFKKSTFYDWLNGKVYPRIDKIEMMAYYFGISKADLVEECNIYTASLTDTPEESFNKEAIAFYTKYLSADKKIRKMIDMLLEEGE